MKIITLILGLVGIKRETSIAQITKPMSAIVMKLESYAEEQKARAVKDAEAAENLLKKSKDETDAAVEAIALASRYSTLTV